MPEHTVGTLVVVVDDTAVEAVRVVGDPLRNVCKLLAVVAFLIGARQQHAETIVEERAADRSRDFRRYLIEPAKVAVTRRCLVYSLGAGDCPEPRLFQRTCRLDVDRRTDAARWNIHAARLVHFYGPDALGCEVAEIKRTTALRRHRTAVQRHEVEFRPHASDRNLRSFVVHAADRHTRDALQGFSEVLVRELADFLGRDRVNDTVGAALAVHGLHQATAYARRDDFLDRFVVLRSGRHAGNGAQSECDTNGQWRTIER